MCLAYVCMDEERPSHCTIKKYYLLTPKYSRTSIITLGLIFHLNFVNQNSKFHFTFNSVSATHVI